MIMDVGRGFRFDKKASQKPEPQSAGWEGSCGNSRALPQAKQGEKWLRMESIQTGRVEIPDQDGDH
jgi:hypothetical protein